MLKVIIVVLVVVACISLLPLKIYLKIQRQPNDLRLTLLIKLWVLPFQLKLNNVVTKIFWNLSQNRPWEKKPPEDLQAAKIVWKRLFSRLALLHEIFRAVFRGAMRTLHKIARPIKITKVYLHTEIGLEDPAQTAIAVGSCWWIWGIIYSQIERYFNMSSTINDLAIIPNYRNQNLLLLDFSCIFELRVGHIMIIMYYLFRNTGNIRKIIRRVSHE